MAISELVVHQLDALKDVLEEIEESNDWDYRFVSDLLIKKEEGRLQFVSIKQLEQLERVHSQYVV